MLVTYSRGPGWMPSAAVGQQDANTSLLHLLHLGIPAGATVWLDLEGPGGTTDDITQYCDVWSKNARDAGFDPGLYVGYGTQLTSQQLYSLSVDRYWHSMSRVTDAGGEEAAPKCGWCMHQLNPTTKMKNGLGVDINFIQEDFRGRVPNWLVAG